MAVTPKAALRVRSESRVPPGEAAHQAGESAKWSVTNLHLPSTHGGTGKIRNRVASNSPLLIPFLAN